MSVNIASDIDAISILTSYAFPKISQYYSSKQQQCILDEYRAEIIEYFRQNEMNMHNFYNSTINKTQFVHNTTTFIHEQNGTGNEDNYSLQTALKKLYIILQLHQHINQNDNCLEMVIPSIPNNNYGNTQIDRNVTVSDIQQTQQEKRKCIQMNMVYASSKPESKILSLQQQAQILKDVADEQQRKLMEAEEKANEYKQTINHLKQELNIEKTCVSQTKDALKESQNRMVILDDKLRQKLMDNQKWMKLKAENERLKRLLFKLQCEQQQKIMNSNVKLKKNEVNMSKNRHRQSAKNVALKSSWCTFLGCVNVT